MPSGGGSQKSSTSVKPYKPARPYIDQSLAAAGQAFNAGNLGGGVYGGDRVANATPGMQQGWNQIASLSRSSGGVAGANDLVRQMTNPNYTSGNNAGTPLDDANRYLQSVLDPSFLNGQNPGMEGILNNITNRANAAASLAGRAGSGSHSGQVAGALAPTIYQDYANRQGMQMQAAGMAPSIDSIRLQAAGMAPGLNQARYYGAQQRLGAGAQQQAQQQAEIQAQMQRFGEQDQSRMKQIQNYQSLLGYPGNYGVTVQNQPNQSNPWLTGLGMATSIGGMFL